MIQTGDGARPQSAVDRKEKLNGFRSSHQVDGNDGGHPAVAYRVWSDQWEQAKQICLALAATGAYDPSVCDPIGRALPRPGPGPAPIAGSRVLVANVSIANGVPAPMGTQFALILHDQFNATLSSSWQQPWNVQYRVESFQDMQRFYLYDPYGNQAMLQLTYYSAGNGEFGLQSPGLQAGGYFFLTRS